MTREEAIHIIDDISCNGNYRYTIQKYLEAKKMAIKALSAEPCEDAISRQAVINEVDNYIEKAQSTSVIDDFISFEELVVKALPPVTPKQKMGQWIVTKKEKITYAECSNCGALYSIKKDTYDFSSAKFCPNCGVKMVESEEEK